MQWPDLNRLLPKELLDRSGGSVLALAASGPMGLVHGDLHPGNVVRTGRGAVAIDPPVPALLHSVMPGDLDRKISC